MNPKLDIKSTGQYWKKNNEYWCSFDYYGELVIHKCDWYKDYRGEHFLKFSDLISDILIEALIEWFDNAEYFDYKPELFIVSKRVKNLQERLELSYKCKDLEKYLDEVVTFNPKFGVINVNAGESHRDEKDDSSCCFSIPVKYSENVDEYFELVSKIKDQIKRVLRILLIDAKKMRLIL